jgi:hypothetical protein
MNAEVERNPKLRTRTIVSNFRERNKPICGKEELRCLFNMSLFCHLRVAPLPLKTFLLARERSIV